MNSRRRKQRLQALTEEAYQKYNPDYEKVKKDVDNLYEKLTDEFIFNQDIVDLNMQKGWWGYNDIIFYNKSKKPIKLFTFIMALKGRSKRALNSIKSIVNENNSNFYI